MLKVSTLPDYYWEKLGKDRIAELTGEPVTKVALWKTKGDFPLAALEKLLAFDPTPIEGIKPLYPKPELKSKLAILMPCNGPVFPETMESVLRLYDPREMMFKTMGFNNLSVLRNALAAWWLGTDCEWAFWVDSDMVFPCGDATFFRRVMGQPQLSASFAGLHTIYRLLVHQKPFVSVCYGGRREGAGVQFAGGEDEVLRSNLRRGPRDDLIERDWCGFGGVLLHRKVLEAIIEDQGKEIQVRGSYLHQRFGYEYSFFSPTTLETPGDDLPFCQRAAKVGFKPRIDLAVFAGHLGTHAFTSAEF